MEQVHQRRLDGDALLHEGNPALHDQAAKRVDREHRLDPGSGGDDDFGRLYRDQNVRINSVCPGPIQTRISAKPDDPHYKWQCDNTVLGRVGYPREVAYAALFLASDEASYVTGATLPVDGGWTSK